MTPQNVSVYLKKYLTKPRLLSFASVLFFGLLAHAFVFTNYLPNWDGLNNLHDPQNTIHLGRCFLTLACGISSYYDLPWVNGLLSFVYIGITATLICELLEVRKTSTRILMSGLLVAFPVVTGTFGYMYTADGYFLSMLCMVLAMFLTLRYKKGLFAGAFLIAFAFGCYQAYITFAMMLVITYSLKQLLFDETPVKKILLNCLRCVLCAGIGLIVYYILNTLLLRIENVTLGDYQGISDIQNAGSILGNIPAAVKQCIIDFVYFFTGSLSDMNLYSVLNILMLGVMAIAYIALIVRKKLWKTPAKLALTVLCFLLVPFCCFAIHFITPDVSYHMLMHGGLYFVYVLFLLPYDRTESDKPAHSVVYQWFCLVLSGMILYNFILIANICYQKQNITVQASMNTVDAMADRIFALEELKAAQNIAVLGRLNGEESAISINLPPDMTGFTKDPIMTHSLHYSNLFADYYYLELDALSDADIEVLTGSHAEVATMPCWPADGSIAVIDDTLIIKLSN